MVFPARTDAQAIRRTALAQLEADGREALSLRRIAAHIGVTPNALYRYYPTREALLAAVADDGARALHATLHRAWRRERGRVGLRALADAYLHFAARRPALYGLMMDAYQPPAAGTADGEAPFAVLWTFVCEAVGEIAAPADVVEASVALWAYLHGVAALERTALFGAHKTRASALLGLELLLDGIARRRA